MRDDLQDLVDRVSAENWDQYLPPLSAVRQLAPPAPSRRPLAIVGAAAVATAAVAIPTTLAHTVGSLDRSRHGTVAAGAGAASCVGSPGTADPRWQHPPIPASVFLTPADAVAGYRLEQQRRQADPLGSLSMASGAFKAPGILAGQQAAAYSSITADAVDPWWETLQTVLRYAPGTAGRGYEAIARALRCTGAHVLSSRGGVTPELIVRMPLRPGRDATLEWAVVTRSGDYVNLLEVVPLAQPDLVSPDAPGLPYLETLAAIVRAKAAGTSAPTLPLPRTATAQAPRGYLLAADLTSAIWRVGTNSGDRGPLTRTFVLPPTPPRCTSGPALPLLRPERSQLYRGQTPKVPSEWMVDEDVLRMTPENAKKTMDAVRNNATACQKSGPAWPVSTPTGVGDEMFIVHSPTDPRYAGFVDAWIRSAGIVIHLNVEAGGNAATVPIPGGDAWVVATARKAMERAQQS